MRCTLCGLFGRTLAALCLCEPQSIPCTDGADSFDVAMAAMNQELVRVKLQHAEMEAQLQVANTKLAASESAASEYAGDPIHGEEDDMNARMARLQESFAGFKQFGG